jgi:hypothetical protein
MKACTTAFLIAAMALWLISALGAQAPPQHTVYSSSIAITAGDSSGTSAAISNGGELRWITSVTPNLASPSYALTVQDSNSVTCYTWSTVADNSTALLTPGSEATFGDAILSLPFGERNGTWTFTATLSTPEASNQTITLYYCLSP